MKKSTLLTFVLMIAGLNAMAQCTPQFTYTPSAWGEPGAPTTPYTGFMCQGHDTLFTRPNWQYYDGDGYFVKLIATSQVIIYTDSCIGPLTSITVVDSTGGPGGLGTVIAGAYAAPACPNTLSFTAPYTGLYYIVYDTDGDCNTSGTAAIGYSAIKLVNASSITNCNPIPAPVNDTICGAIAVTLGTTYSGNTALAEATDPRDADVTASGITCSAPNNTMWYSFTPAATGDYELSSNSPATGGASLWFAVFEAANCTAPLTYIDCLTGADPGIPFSDTVALNAGTNYYIMVDGFSGSTGQFEFFLTALSVGINEINSGDLNVFPNPFRDEITINNKSNVKDFNVEIVNVMGQVVYSSRIENLVNQVIDTKDFANGIYMVRFQNENGTITKKLIKQ
jgi:hypothetical protein